MKYLNQAIDTLKLSLSDRKDIVATTSFGFQSSMLFYLLREANINCHILYISSSLAYGGIEKQKDYIEKTFGYKTIVVDREKWLNDQLNGRKFTDLDETEKEIICKGLKKDPLLEFIQRNNIGVWISGIRRDQTKSRKSLQFLDTTDLGVSKISPMFNLTNTDIKASLDEMNLMVNEQYIDLCKLNPKLECGLHT